MPVAVTYDVIIIGAGPGGYVAAIRAAQLGLKTAIVEREHLAGICSNWGCIPNKALLRSDEVMHLASHAKDYGLAIDGVVKPDLNGIVERSRGIAARMNGGVGILMKKNKVDVIWGEAKLTKPNEIVVAKTSKKPMEPQVPAPKNVLGEDQGLVKTVFDKKTGQLLGAHMVGAEVTELIQGFVVAMNLETTEEELMHTIFPHPTLSEMMKESVLDAYGRALNM
jgi:pyruvate/2-oxoglutarate dehydrogenase complex dihydrolipoamide dehydrogenase (E3) component